METITTFEEYLNHHYGRAKNLQKEHSENESLNYRLGEMLKIERKKAKLTQEQLAKRIGTKKSYISRIETGKSDIQISTLNRIIELGLNKKIYISII